VRRAHWGDRIVRLVGYDGIGEDETTAGAQSAVDAAEQVRLPRRVQVMAVSAETTRS
jgi:hypothetical protein